MKEVFDIGNNNEAKISKYCKEYCKEYCNILKVLQKVLQNL